MMPIDLLKPGINIKRWILLGIVGILFLVYGIIEFFNKKYLLTKKYRFFYSFHMVLEF